MGVQPVKKNTKNAVNAVAQKLKAADLIKREFPVCKGGGESQNRCLLFMGTGQAELES